MIKATQNVPKIPQKTTFQDLNFGPADEKNAIETLFWVILSLQKSKGAIVIDFWEKSNFWGIDWITKR